MNPRAVDAERTSRRWLMLGAVSAGLWQAARIVPGSAPVWLIAAATVMQMPLAVTAVLGMWQAAQHRGWAAGYEATQPRPIPDERTRR